MFENNNPQLGKEIDAANQTATGRQRLSSFDENAELGNFDERLTKFYY